MPFKAPLSAEQLRTIRERQPWNPDVIALLWEIKRMDTMRGGWSCWAWIKVTSCSLPCASV